MDTLSKLLGSVCVLFLLALPLVGCDASPWESGMALAVKVDAPRQSGKALLEEQKKIRKKFREEAGFMPGQFFDGFLTKMSPEKIGEIRASMKRLAMAMFQIGNNLRDNYSEERLSEALGVIDEASKKLGEIAGKVKGEKH